MPYLEHPAIEKVNQHGYLGAIEDDSSIEICECCNTVLKRGDTAVEFQEYLFCDNECLTEAFTENPEIFGVEKRKLT